MRKLRMEEAQNKSRSMKAREIQAETGVLHVEFSERAPWDFNPELVGGFGASIDPLVSGSRATGLRTFHQR